jgi:hypothetical protein
MVYRLALVIGLCVVLSLLSPSGNADAKPRTISLGEGRELVYALLKPSGWTTQTCDVEKLPDKYFPQLFSFEVRWSNPMGSPHIGAWAVDPKTADLWDANVCVEYRPPGVARLQRMLRKRIGLAEKEYKRLKGRPPMCDPGERIEVRTGRY